MIGDIVRKSGGHAQVVLDAIGADSRVGKKLTRYGFGYGGPCFPRDNRALGIYASDINLPAEISRATDDMNQKHLRFQLIDHISNHSWDRAVAFGRISASRHRDAIWYESVTYKEESTMIEESQQLRFAELLARCGYRVVISDSQTVLDAVEDLYGDLFMYERRCKA